jgi:alkyl sulfatase BDS1-like metallo-beta-lactamase superfamily hydrolase
MMMGGADAVRVAAAEAAAVGEISEWQWALRLTSLLLQIDSSDELARATRATAARALGQRTTSSNARGWYITEALELEGKLLALGKPVTIAEVRAVLGTPRREELIAAGTAASLGFLPVLVDPTKAGESRIAFTLEIGENSTPWLIELRNGVIVTEPAKAPLPDHVVLTAGELADFVLGLAALPPGSVLTTLDSVLDRSVFAFLPASPATFLEKPAAELHMLGEGSQ